MQDHYLSDADVLLPCRLHRSALGDTQVLDLLAKVYNCLTKKLKGKKYFFGRPTRLDAAVYAHILYHKSSPVGELLFGSTLKNYPALSKYVDDISRAHFGPEAAALKDPGKSERLLAEKELRFTR